MEELDKFVFDKLRKAPKIRETVTFGKVYFIQNVKA